MRTLQRPLRSRSVLRVIPRYGVAALALLAPLGAAAYEAQGPYLREPEAILPFIAESMQFWLKAWDAEPSQLAFFSNVGLTGTPSGTDKAFLAQTRNAYAFSKAFMVTGDTGYLHYADNALRFMYDFGWDKARGGWWGMANANGTINTSLWYNSTRWSFWQHYMLLGISAYVEATGDPFHADWLETGNLINDQKLWDSRPGYEGYYMRTSLNWVPSNEKGFTPTVDAITTSALTNYLMTGDAMRRERLVALGDNIADKMMNPANGHAVSFPSVFDNDWRVVSGTSAQQTTSIGHHIKTAWCLARVYLIEPDQKYKAAAEQLLDEVWHHRDGGGRGMWDHDNGIMRGSINVFTGAVGGTADWWTVEQGYTAGIMNWYVSRKPEYLELADKSLRFFMDYYQDYENGEVFSVVASNGQVSDTKKGDMFKAGYHSNELYYLAYLYGNLYYRNRPVTVHYTFPRQAQVRTVKLWPIAYEDDRLVISRVTRNGINHTAFDGASRTLTVPANTEAVFAVTFESRYATNPPAHHGRGWWNDWFGWYFHDKDTYPWVYHPDHGWSYLIGKGKDRAHWFYSAQGGYYYYARAEWYPAVYRSDIGWDHGR